MRSRSARWLALALSGVSSTVLAAPQAPSAQSHPAAGPGIEPFAAHYIAEWHDISVGTSDLKLERDGPAGRYHYSWVVSARGIFRLVYSDDLTQQSWFAIVDDHVRPDHYRGAQGSSSVSFQFDWSTGRAFGSSEGKPIDLVLKPGTQDLLSIQVEIMLDLKNGNLPTNFSIIDKDQVKDFLYTREGNAKLRTSIGSFDTIIVASRHDANDRRVLRMWFAPSLGFVPLQAERTRDGKLEFAMRIRSLKR